MIYDFIVIGAGISGTAAAYELSCLGTLAIVEAETAPGYHSTGRSAALYTKNFGSPVVRKINAASYGFLQNPPPEFCDLPLLNPRGLMTVAGSSDADKLTLIHEQSTSDAPIEMLSAKQVCEISPFLRPELIVAATLEPGVDDIDVDALHQAYLRAIKSRDCSTVLSMRINSIERKTGVWHVSADGETIKGKTLVNAAGAWADQIAIMAKTKQVGLVAKRRTAIIFAAPEYINTAKLPAIDFADCESYIKPDAGRLMASPGDETPVEPQDVQPEEWDIAVIADWLQQRTFIEVERIDHSWAGLRTFVADFTPVVGFDPLIEDFFWLAGQGGYGIMMAPALGRATSSLISDGQLPSDLLDLGVNEHSLSPYRSGLSAIT